jgi:hypothetical protein
MGQPPTWTSIDLRRPKVYIKCRTTDLKEAMQEENLLRRLVMDPILMPKPNIQMRISP